MTQTTSPIGLSARVAPLAAVRHALTLAWRSLVQIKHNPMELIDLSLQPLMFVLLFAYVFGGAISGSVHDFLQFGLAGIITQNALFLTMNTAVALNSDIDKGVFDRFRSLPIAFNLCFSWLPVLVGMLVDEPEKVQAFGFVVIFPLTFASSAFVPTATMPGWLQAWVKVNPVTMLADAMRGLLVGGDVAGPVLGSLAWAAAIAVVFAPLALRAFRRRA